MIFSIFIQYFEMYIIQYFNICKHWIKYWNRFQYFIISIFRRNIEIARRFFGEPEDPWKSWKKLEIR